MSDNPQTPPQTAKEIVFSPGTIALIALGLIAITVLRYVGLHTSEMEMGFDEAQYWTWSLDPDWGYFSKPPLLAWMIWLQNVTCGTDEVCTRIYVPITHLFTSIVVFFIGKRLFDPTVGIVASAMYLLLPGVTFSSRLITTDVPLLFFWAIGLYALLNIKDRIYPLTWGLILGVAFGLGLLAKYAMIYFALCLLIFAAVSPEGRRALFSRGMALALFVTLLVLAPNIYWNIQNGLITFIHTADNIEGSGGLLNFDEAAEFVGAQFGVFGPIPLIVLAVTTWLWFSPRTLGGDADVESPNLRLLLIFSVPVVLLIIGQALLSRAHANWAAPAYVAGSVLVAAMLVRLRAERWLVATFAIHIAFQGLVLIGDARASTVKLPGTIDLYYRALGYKSIAAQVDERFKSGDYAAVLTDWRRTTGTLMYNLRADQPPIYTWPPKPRPTDHFQMSVPLTESVGEPLLLITKCNNVDRLNAAFDAWELIEVISAPGGPKYNWVFFLIEASGPKFGAEMPPPDCDRFPKGPHIVPRDQLPPERVRG
ncbi:MAG: glycosyltransferase family 39 protein [Pseudomonadota bacterium]